MTHPGVEDLIPHRPPMLLVDQILAEDAATITCRGHIPDSLATAGRASSLIGIELGAQAAAVHQALARTAGEDSRPRVGYLVSVVEAQFEEPSLPAERGLTIRAVRERGVHPLARYSISVSLDGRSAPSVVATLSTMIAS